MTRQTINRILLLLLLSVLIVAAKQSISNKTDLQNFVVDQCASLVVTFVGVYCAFLLAKSQEQRSEQKTYVSGLELIVDELTHNREVLNHTLGAITELDDSLKNNLSLHLSLFSFLLDIARMVKHNMFYGIVSSGAISEFSTNDQLFINLRFTYHEIEAIPMNLRLSKNISKDFSGKNKYPPTAEEIVRRSNMINDHKRKITQTLEAINRSIEVVTAEIFRYRKDTWYINPMPNELVASPKP